MHVLNCPLVQVKSVLSYILLVIYSCKFKITCVFTVGPPSAPRDPDDKIRLACGYLGASFPLQDSQLSGWLESSTENKL